MTAPYLLICAEIPDTEENRKEYVETLADYFFATRLSPGEIENYINLARKREKSQTLSMVVNRDQATSITREAAPEKNRQPVSSRR